MAKKREWIGWGILRDGKLCGWLAQEGCYIYHRRRLVLGSSTWRLLKDCGGRIIKVKMVSQ